MAGSSRDLARVTFLQRNAQLNWTLVFVAVSVICSWLLGATGLSLAWLLLLLALVAAVWKTSLVRLVEAAISYETLRVRRKRALSQDETAEWFNFLLNRWWVFSSRSLFTIVKERLEPLLNEAKPSFVENFELR
jgi:Ca2+-dependent lipid-binding protein